MRLKTVALATAAVVVLVLLVAYLVKTKAQPRSLRRGAPLDFFLPPVSGYLHSDTDDEFMLRLEKGSSGHHAGLEDVKNLCKSLGGKKCAGVTKEYPGADEWLVVLRNPGQQQPQLDHKIPYESSTTFLTRDPSLPPVQTDPTYNPPINAEGHVLAMIKSWNVGSPDYDRIADERKNATLAYCRFLGREKCKGVSEPTHAAGYVIDQISG